jgi:uncharacterized protein YdhG (YjbR/CyaY superfamily)
MKKVSNTADYLAALPTDQRTALEKVRKQILAAAPGAEEHFGYGLPGLNLLGHPFIYFGAAKNHCALYGALNDGTFNHLLKGFKMSKGTIQFTPEKPVPAAVVKAIVKAKLAAHMAKWGSKPSVKKAKATPKADKMVDGTAEVDAYMKALKHPQKNVIQAVREVILKADKRMRERVKWNAPSFYHVTTDGTAMDFAAFNPRAKGFVQLILLFPMGVIEDPAKLLQGDWKDRREARFVDLSQVSKKKAALKRVVKEWIKRIER